MSRFNLPDLGEGLAEAEIVRWHVKVGDKVEFDAPLVAVETAKAVVEVPSPYTGVITALHGAPGDTVSTGGPLVDFDVESAAKSSDAAAGHAAASSAAARPAHDEVPKSGKASTETANAGTAPTGSLDRVRAAPAVRALAKRMGVDLTTLKGTGRSGLVTADDVTSAALPPHLAAQSFSQTASGVPNEQEKLHGLRRAMVATMSMVRDQVVPCTLFDDADLALWREGNDYTIRLLRAIAAGCAAEPGLNAWFDAESLTRTRNPQIDVGIAVDTPDGLLVPVVRNVGGRSSDELREEVDRLKHASLNRSLAPDELRNFTFMLTNFGMIAGRYATPVIVPPAVAILGAGRLSHDVVAVTGGIETHLRLPLSLSFDHRCITGGEAARFLAAVLADLQRTN